MSAPDFLIIGAMKCGTSTLAAQLGAQSGLFLTTPKEPNYFSDDDVFAKGPAWYASLFAAAAHGDLKGEASTHYTKQPTHPNTLDRLAAAVPAPRLVYIIRDPVERAVSHYIHEWTQGVITGSLEDALITHPALVDYGRYGYQIAPFADRFGTEAICLLDLAEIKRDPQGALDRVCWHIGHGGMATWQEDLGRVNASAERIRRLPMHDLLIESPVAKALRRTLVPKALRNKVRQRRKMIARPELPDAARARMEQTFAADREILACLFPGAPALTGAYPFLET